MYLRPLGLKTVSQGSCSVDCGTFVSLFFLSVWPLLIPPCDLAQLEKTHYLLLECFLPSEGLRSGGAQRSPDPMLVARMWGWIGEYLPCCNCSATYSTVGLHGPLLKCMYYIEKKPWKFSKNVWWQQQWSNYNMQQGYIDVLYKACPLT